jgi:hypothetical protein
MANTPNQRLYDRMEAYWKRPSPAFFDDLAMDVFREQASRNPVYARYLELLGCDTTAVQYPGQIPFLPISLFKTHLLRTGEWTPEMHFTSSGTTAKTASRHDVRKLEVYLQNTERGFRHFFGPVEGYAVLALLPSYLERQGSSLVAMAGHFIRRSGYPESGFFLHQYDALIRHIDLLMEKRVPTLLLGVTFALLDLAERGPFRWSGLMVMETGGMKGRRREMVREEVHRRLCAAFAVDRVYSEYGMTELFSQAYSMGDGLFRPAPGMRVQARQITDPFAAPPLGKTGVLNIIDLANLDTISFVATDDLGRVFPDGSFEVLGRLDHSDLRGCNLLVL